MPASLLKAAIDAAQLGESQGVAQLCAWFNRTRDVSLAPAASAHLWVRDAIEASRVWIALGRNQVEFDDITLLTQPSWHDAVATVGEDVYVVFIAEQTSFVPNEVGCVELALVNGRPYEGYDVPPWDDRVVAMRELAGFPQHFPRVWQAIVETAEREAM